MIGSILVKFAFVTCLISVLAYFQNHRNGDARFQRIGRIFYHATVLSVIGTAGILLYLILTHQFQYTYVWSYSSRELTTPLLFSTFYAGQEGSFMLWTLFTTIIGVFLLRDSATKGYEPQVMSVFGLITLSLLVMLIAKNPFLYVWDSFPGQVEAGFVPANGRGLNPLLQNYWMVIHPQVLFSGFASMSVPYAYAVAAMMKRDYTNWFRPATPWLVFAALVLGTGIMMGGFWAYETLGWGGYWGWDPVENSSLVPWLVCIAALHMILSQRKSGAFVKTNLVLGMLCFIMVLYSTFLTRSGVLGDTSVHSFVDPGMMVYWLLIGMIGLFAGLGIAMLLIRFREIPRPAVQHEYYSREFALFLASMALVVAALFITAGTSSPIISDILQGKKSAMDVSYYVSTNLPLGIAVGLLAGIGQLLWWHRSKKADVLKAALLPFILAVIATGVLVCVGIEDPLVALFVLGAAFAIFANARVAWRIVKGHPRFAGGAVAHIGLGIMFLGFVASSKYDAKQTVALTQGEPVGALGYTLTYSGYRLIDNEKYAFHVIVEKEGRHFVVAPVMFHSTYNDGLMRNPDIVNLITEDFYLAPLSLDESKSDARGAVEKSVFKPGQKHTVGELEITFLGFDLPLVHNAAMMQGKDQRVAARLLVQKYGMKPVVITPAKVMQQGNLKDEPATFDQQFEFTMQGMSPERESRENSFVEIGVKNLLKAAAQDPEGGRDILVVEASIKPFINLVWSGVIIVLVGFLVTIIRRSKEAALRSPVEETVSD